MTLAQIADYADLFTAVAVLGSLVFVVIELRRSNRQTRIANWFSGSTGILAYRDDGRDPGFADLVVRGRQSWTSLTETEQFLFQNHLLRCLIAHGGFIRQRQVVDTGPQEFGATAAAVILDEPDHPGSREWWRIARQKKLVAEVVVEFVDAVLGIEEPSS